jgi:exosome complex component RRP41
MEIIQADSGTRVAAITAASLALANAGIPMRDLVSSTAAGRVNKEIVVDLNKDEEDVEDAIDMPVAMMPRLGKVTLLQLDGDASLKEVEEMLKIAKKGCDQIYKEQQKALREKFKVK